MKKSEREREREDLKIPMGSAAISTLHHFCRAWYYNRQAGVCLSISIVKDNRLRGLAKAIVVMGPAEGTRLKNGAALLFLADLAERDGATRNPPMW